MILVDKVTTLPLGILFLVYKGTDQTAPAFSVALPELPFHAGSEDDPLLLDGTLSDEAEEEDATAYSASC